MPLINRDTVIDRPVLLNRGGEDGQDENEAPEEEYTSTTPEEGELVINGIEFEAGEYDIVSAANIVAVLATGDTEGESYKNVFRNAAIQLEQLKEVDKEDFSAISELAARKSVDLLNVSGEQAAELRKEQQRQVGSASVGTVVSNHDNEEEASSEEPDDEPEDDSGEESEDEGKQEQSVEEDDDFWDEETEE